MLSLWIYGCMPGCASLLLHLFMIWWLLSQRKGDKDCPSSLFLQSTLSGFASVPSLVGVQIIPNIPRELQLCFMWLSGSTSVVHHLFYYTKICRKSRFLSCFTVVLTCVSCGTWACIFLFSMGLTSPSCLLHLHVGFFSGMWLSHLYL